MADADTSRRLGSWKEIAAYLKCDQRSAMRWEKERGLPVHRLPGKRSGVFAYVHEIEAWLANQTSDLRDAAQPESAHPSALRWARHILVAGTIAMGAVAALWMVIPRFFPPESPAEIRFIGNRVMAIGHRGNTLWTFGLPGMTQPLILESESAREYYQLHDLDGDAKTEVLLKLCYHPAGKAPSSSACDFVVLSAEGKLLYRFVPEEEFRFQGRPFGPPWILSTFLVTSREAQKSIWLAYRHAEWWPSLLIKLDRSGRAVGRFVHAGWIERLCPAENEDGQFVLVGGIRNESASAFLAVLREDDPSGSSPHAPDSEFHCDDCPAGVPYRYFTFEKSEITEAFARPYNQMGQLRFENGAHILVYTSEGSMQRGETYGQNVFLFDANYNLREMQFDDFYWAAHDAAHRAGRISHPSSQCPQRETPPRVREWRDGAWHIVTPNASRAQTSRSPKTRLSGYTTSQ